MCVWGWAPRFECVPAQKTQVLTFSSSSRLTFLWTSEMSMSTTPVAQTEEEHDEGKYKIHVYIFICTSEDGQASSNLIVCFLSRKTQYIQTQHMQTQYKLFGIRSIAGKWCQPIKSHQLWILLQRISIAETKVK